MNERSAIASLGVLGILSLIFAPWAVVNREIGARGTLLLLPDRIFDFTGRTAPFDVQGMLLVLILSLAGFVLLVGSAFIAGRSRYLTWLAAGALLVVATLWGFQQVGTAVDQARIEVVTATVRDAMEDPTPRQDPQALAALLEEMDELTLNEAVAAAGEAGLRIRRLPYSGVGMSLAAALAMGIGILSLFFGLRAFPRASRAVDRFVGAAAVPAISIILALLASGVVILLLQETPVGSGASLDDPLTWLVGRLDTLWFAYTTLFSDSLGSVGGFMESLKFATPLIFTGLSVAFGFRLGLFNIGAPGQMVLGAIGAAAVGVYLPGPGFIVLPLAVVAAAVMGGLWGALPGWLKARFGANEVINTILLNYIAASMLLFLLTDRPTFAAAAIEIFRMLAVAIPIIVVLLLIPQIRRLAMRAPRVSFAVVGIALLVAMVAVAVPVAADPAVEVRMPFKAPGFEPKSYPLQEGARIAQVPALFGIDLQQSPGVNVVPTNLALLLAPVVALLGVWLAKAVGIVRWPWRIAAGLGLGVVSFLVMALFGLTDVDFAVPPTNLNLSFLIAIAMAVFMQVLLWQTKWGYNLRAVGVSPKAAEYGGASIGGSVIAGMAIAGAFAGLTATHYVLGGALDEYALRQSLPTNDGFDGIAVALLGANNPLGVVLAAFLFGVLKNGGAVLNITYAGLTRDVVTMILALVVLFIAARGFLPERIANPLRRRQEEQASELREPLDPPGKPVRTEEG